MTKNSWRLSGFGDEIDPSPDVQAAVLCALGIQNVDFRSAWDTNVVALSAEQLAGAAAAFGRQGVSVAAVASPVGKVPMETDPEAEVERLRIVARAARALGTNLIRVFSFLVPREVDPATVRDLVLFRMQRLVEVAEAEGLVLLHENEKAIYGDTPERVVDLIESIGSERLRAIWDPANFVQVGIDHPMDRGYSLVRPYLDYIHVKDAKRGAAGDAAVLAGHGDGQIGALLTELALDGFDGVLSLEPHLVEARANGGFSGPAGFGKAAAALQALLSAAGVRERVEVEQ